MKARDSVPGPFRAMAGGIAHYVEGHPRLPNIIHPRTFNEKILYRKLHDRSEAFVRLSDKVLAKDYVAERIGSQYVTPTLWHGTELPADAATRWERPFAIKSNAGSGHNFFVRPGDDVDWNKVRKGCAKWLAADHGGLGETWYGRIERQILVEPMIGEQLDDFRLLVFSGAVRAIYLHRRTSTRTIDFFTPDWQHLDVSYNEPHLPVPIAEPPHLREMIVAAEALAAGFAFVRVDFYDLADGPRFGEMTFSPNAGNEPFQPAGYDRVLGDYWTGPLIHPD